MENYWHYIMERKLTMKYQEWEFQVIGANGIDLQPVS